MMSRKTFAAYTRILVWVQGLKQTTITSKIPSTKRSMERFLFHVKALLHSTSSGCTFWMGKFPSQWVIYYSMRLFLVYAFLVPNILCNIIA